MPESAVVLLVTVVVAVPAAVVLVFSLRRQRRDYASLGTSEASAAAFSLPPRVNWQIGRAIRSGRAVEDPGLATLAADRAEHVVRGNELGLRRFRALRWFYLAGAALVVTGIILAIIDGGLTRAVVFRICWQVLVIGVFAALPASMRRRVRRAGLAAEANRALAAAHPDATWNGPRVDPGRARMRRTAAVWIGGVVVLTPVSYVFSRLDGAALGWPLAAGFAVLVMTLTLAASWYVIPAAKTDRATTLDN